MIKTTLKSLRNIDHLAVGAQIAHWAELHKKIYDYMIDQKFSGQVLADTQIYLCEIELKIEQCRRKLNLPQQLQVQ